MGGKRLGIFHAFFQYLCEGVKKYGAQLRALEYDQ
jgi:hypothetical protein